VSHSDRYVVRLPMISRFRFIRHLRVQSGPQTLAFVTGVYVALVLNNTFWEKVAEYLHQDPSSVFALYAAICSFFVILTTAFAGPYVLRPALVFFVWVAAVSSWFVDSYGVVIDTDMVRNTFETTTAEASDLLTPGFLLHLAIYAGIPSLIIVSARIRYPNFRRTLARNAIVMISLAAVFGTAAITFYKPYSTVVRTKRDLVKTLNPITPLVSTFKYATAASRERAIVVLPRGEDAQIMPASDGSRKPRVTILVVGETARASNFSLDGYGRQTNPRLQEQGVLYFSNVRSCGTATDVSLPCMFSDLGRSQYTHSKGLSNENVLDVLSRAGVDVTWIDNNTGSKGVADRVRFESIAGSSNAEFCQDGNCLDAAFFQKIDDWLANVKKDSVLVLHQLGNHGPAYYKRYPEAFRRYQPDCRTSELTQCADQEIVNAYDNAILYTDFVLSGIVDRLKARKSVISPSMLYVSDHGESLGEKGLYLHGTPYFFAPDEQTRIPLVLWADKSFLDGLGASEGCLDAKRKDPFSHDNLFSSVLGMMNIATSAYRPELDLLRSCRNPAGVEQRS
jgi:lipid A ethanolaminephosphotransferase